MKKTVTFNDTVSVHIYEPEPLHDALTINHDQLDGIIHYQFDPEKPWHMAIYFDHPGPRNAFVDMNKTLFGMLQKNCGLTIEDLGTGEGNHRNPLILAWDPAIVDEHSHAYLTNMTKNMLYGLVDDAAENIYLRPRLGLKQVVPAANNQFALAFYDRQSYEIFMADNQNRLAARQEYDGFRIIENQSDLSVHFSLVLAKDDYKKKIIQIREKATRHLNRCRKMPYMMQRAAEISSATVERKNGWQTYTLAFESSSHRESFLQRNQAWLDDLQMQAPREFKSAKSYENYLKAHPLSGGKQLPSCKISPGSFLEPHKLTISYHTATFSPAKKEKLNVLTHAIQWKTTIIQPSHFRTTASHEKGYFR